MKNKLTIKEGRKIVEKIQAIKECKCHCHNNHEGFSPSNPNAKAYCKCLPRCIHCQLSEKEKPNRLNQYLNSELDDIEQDSTCSGACAGCDLTTDHCEHCCQPKQDRSWENDFDNKIKGLTTGTKNEYLSYDNYLWIKSFIKSLLQEQEERIRREGK